MEMQTSNTADPADAVIAQAELRQRRRRWWIVAVGLVGLVVGYPLSAGPMLRAMGNVGAFPPFLRLVIEIYFFPLEWAYSNSEWVEAFYDWYLPFFGVR